MLVGQSRPALYERSKTRRLHDVRQAAEFILENQSPQLTPPTDQFPRFSPFSMQGYARTNNGTVTVGSDPTVFLLADFPHARPHVTVTLSPVIATTNFSADPWSGFTVAPAGSAGLNSHIASVSRKPDTMEVFSNRANGSVQDAYWYDGMPAWKRFEIAPGQSAAPASGIAAVARVPNSMQIFWIAPNGSVQDAYWYEGMPAWKRQELAPPGSAATTSTIAAVSRIPNNLEIFWTAPNGSVHDAYWYEGMPAWKSFEIAPAGSAATDGGLAGGIAQFKCPGNFLGRTQRLRQGCLLVRRHARVEEFRNRAGEQRLHFRRHHRGLAKTRDDGNFLDCGQWLGAGRLLVRRHAWVEETGHRASRRGFQQWRHQGRIPKA